MRHPNNGMKYKDLAKKEEASAGSGGTAVHALAGGGNQSFLTDTAVRLGERRIPQSSIATHARPSLFHAPWKKIGNMPGRPAPPPFTSLSLSAGFPQPQPISGLTAQSRAFRVFVALLLGSFVAAPFYVVHADLISEFRARQLGSEPVSTRQHKTQPLQRLRDTVFQADVQWPSAPDRPFEKDASLPLEAMTLDADPDTRVQGLLGLADAQSPNTISRLAAALDDPDPQVRETALQKLASLDPGRLVQELVLRLDSPDGAYPISLEEVLPTLKQRLERPLMALLRDRETAHDTRIVAVRILGLMGSERAVHELSSQAFQADDTGLALAATQALALVASPDALPALNALTLHPTPGIRTEALHGLARIGGPIALSGIEAMALNPRENNARIRREAIAYIGLMGADPSIDVLISVMNRYPQTREEVVAALRRLTGLNLGNSPLEWTQWRYKQQKALEEAQEEAPPSVAILGIIPGAGGEQHPQ